MTRDDQILDAWARGEMVEVIAAVHNLLEGRIYTIVAQARRQGDPRAKRRTRHRRPWLPDRHLFPCREDSHLATLAEFDAQ